MSIQYLYKYGRINPHCEERTEAIFSSPALWFSSPADLNDPFECRPWITSNGTRDQVVDFLARMLKQHSPHLVDEEVTAHAVSIFLEGRHRDPSSWEGFRKDLIGMLNREIGLCCFSEVNHEILMWSHYADEHRGYCLMFEATDLSPFFGTAKKVTYSADLPVIDFFNTPANEQAEIALLTKYCGWSYEKEWRITNHDVGSGRHEYPPESLRGVIFGSRMTDENRAKIRAWVRLRGHPVRFFEAVQSDRHFKVDVTEIS